jgi:hypothetical protein
MKPVQLPPARPARTAAVLVVVVALAWPAAACSGSPSATGPGGSSNAAAAASSPAVSYSHCMRSHGVPNFPDPGSGGSLPKGTAQQFGVSSAQLQAAELACQHVLPSTGDLLTPASLQQCYLTHVCPPALVQRALSAGRTFAHCMRSHGVPTWPDPTIETGGGAPQFDIRVSRPPSPQVAAAISTCERLAPAGSLLAWG